MLLTDRPGGFTQSCVLPDVPLQSELFRDHTALQACLVKDFAHIVKGARGPHVDKIQTALCILEGAIIDSNELAAERSPRHSSR
jgi:hypothetical protein